ncbi:hypothetical protein OFB79_24050, partial [Escherichia coli]|nr:hypothetical protein [Escherichia coli]
NNTINLIRIIFGFNSSAIIFIRIISSGNSFTIPIRIISGSNSNNSIPNSPIIINIPSRPLINNN